MSQVIDLEEGRLLLMVKRSFRNWKSRFKEEFGRETRLSQISTATLSYLAQGRDKGTFYLYDLIMNLNNLGSGFEFNELSPKKKMAVIDQYLFLLDRVRLECMKRMGWLDSYPGDEFALVELIAQFDKLAPGLQARVPNLSRNHPDYMRYAAMDTLDREAFVRKLIPKALEEIQYYLATL
ncbi:MAG: hypothetical protein SV775_06085 [Thermodesulfobacteriota bacterium]|nr:hypothetical protein [Thermodesulfobacteriota bacterium]